MSIFALNNKQASTMTTDHTQLNIAIFASGSGSNAENIIRYFGLNRCRLKVALVVTNRPDAGVISRAGELGTPVSVITRETLNDPSHMQALLDSHDIDIIVLAGFLLMIPAHLIRRYSGRMVNIHPSLLPKYGGKGMYGHRVHEAVVANRESETGITIHLVSERYDEGPVIFQATTQVTPQDTPDTVEQKVRALETLHFPRVIRDTFDTAGP